MVEEFDLQHHVVKVPSNTWVVLDDVNYILPFICKHGAEQLPNAHIIYKVWVEVLRPMTYVVAALNLNGFSKALTGFCADAYYGSGVAASKILHYEGFDAWHAYRMKYVEHPLNADAVVKRWAAERDVDLHDCWADKGVRDLMMSKGPDQLQKPKPKWYAVEAFPEFWKPWLEKTRQRARWYRENSPLQVSSGIREDHHMLLEDKHINKRGRKAVIALYYDLAEDMGLDPRGKEKMARHASQGSLFSDGSLAYDSQQETGDI
jgi:hypothetical protein